MADELQSDDRRLVCVDQRATEGEASIVVAALTDAGIRAVATGGFTAGFRAEAPGWVQIQTFAHDAQRAREVIAEIEKRPPADWMPPPTDD